MQIERVSIMLVCVEMENELIASCSATCAFARAPIESNRFELYKSSIRLEGSNLYVSSICSKLANFSTNICISQTLVTYITYIT